MIDRDDRDGPPGGFDGNHDDDDDRRRSLKVSQDELEGTQYYQNVTKMVKYLTIYGMIEQYYDNEYTTFGDTNEDVYTWKEYSDHDVVLNTHGMY